ncbi:MAG: lptC [Gammaproteobacteria bacterium]|jgi:lipopolysaccharide export system protein LptC|nr:lptC [Gammaproteobacteria bacterium]
MIVPLLKNAIISFLIILALSLSSWFIFIAKHTQALHSEASHRPDAFMEEVIATIINKEGTPALKIEAPKMTHYPDNDTTDIKTPHITMYRHSPEPWHIRANYAKATQGLSQIYFWDHVIIHHISDRTNPTTTMITRTLTVFPDTQIAQTNDNVTLTQPDTTIQGVGMLANLNDGTVQLISQARGEYVPNHS